MTNKKVGGWQCRVAIDYWSCRTFGTDKMINEWRTDDGEMRCFYTYAVGELVDCLVKLNLLKHWLNAYW